MSSQTRSQTWPPVPGGKPANAAIVNVFTILCYIFSIALIRLRYGDRFVNNGGITRPRAGRRFA
jgi:hypothetical protein